MSIKNLDAVRIIEEHRGEALIVTTMNSGNPQYGMPRVSRREEIDIPLVGAMGKASSLALGLALARPERKIMVLDGDGSLLMNLGTLATISEKAPDNLYHFVFENGVYAVTGGQPIPGENKLSFQGMAKQAGYAATYEFDNSEDLETNIDSVLAQGGPVFVCLKIVPEIDNTPVQFREKPRRNIRDAKEDLGRVFGL